MKVEIRKGHELPIKSLTDYLSCHVTDFTAPLVEIKQFEGGQVCILFLFFF